MVKLLWRFIRWFSTRDQPPIAPVAAASNDAFVIAEFQALRAEIVHQLGQITTVVQTAVVLAVALYGAPLVLHKGFNLQFNTFEIWLSVVLAVDVVLYVLSIRLLVIFGQLRRIGTYIAEVLEPKTRGGMEYERALRFVVEHDRTFVDEASYIVWGLCFLHVLSAGAIWLSLGITELRNAAIPFVALLPLLAVAGRRIGEALHGKTAGREQVAKLLREYQDTGKAKAAVDRPLSK